MLYYIYKITNLVTNQLYVGYTINPIRRENEYRILKCKEQRLLYKSIKHYGWNNHKFEIFCTCIEDLYQNLEIYFIKHFNSYYYNNKKIGLNLSEGGDRPPRMPGKLNPMYGKTHTEESRNKISKKLTGKSSPFKGIKMSKERYNKHLSSIENTKIKINQYSLEGKFIQQWNSIKEASRALSVSDSTIINVCKKKQGNNSAGGFIWRYSNNDDFNIVYKNKILKPIIQLDINGKELRRFTSLAATKELGFNSNSISKAITNRWISQGFKWKYA